MMAFACLGLINMHTPISEVLPSTGVVTQPGNTANGTDVLGWPIPKQQPLAQTQQQRQLLCGREMEALFLNIFLIK